MQRRIFALLVGLTLIGAIAAPVAAVAPDPPTGVIASVAGNTVTVSWTPPELGDPVEDYTVTLDNGGGTATTTGTSADVLNVPPGTYIATVTANNPDGSSAGATSGQFVVAAPPTVPDPPTAVNASANGDTQIDVSWTAPGNNGGSAITSYTVSLTGQADQVVTAPGTSTSFVGLDPGTYTATVVATNGVGDSGSASSGSVTLTAPPTVPDAPTGVNASANGDTQIDVSWTAPGNNGGSAITSYTVSLTGQADQVVTAPGTSTSFVGLDPGTYTATVVATNGVGDSGSASSGSATLTAPPTVPDAPTGVNASANGDTQIDVSWTAPGNNGGSAITSYTVSLTGQADQVVTAPGTSTSFVGLDPGTYTATVVATNGVGDSGSASSGSVTLTAPPTVPDPPTAVNASLVGETSLSVTWGAPGNNGGSPVIDYTVTLDNGGGSQTVGGPSVQFDGLARGTTYTATVVARNAIGDSAGAASNPVPIPAAAVPNTPGGLNLTVLGNSQLLATWDAPNNNGAPITNYRVRLSDGRTFDTGTNTQLTIDAPPGNYTFTVFATNAQGNSATSATSPTATIATAPDAPSGVSASVSGSTVTISWTAPNDNFAPIDFYTVKLSNGQEVFTGNTSRSFTLPAGTYSALVSATNSVGEGPNSPRSNTVQVLTASSPPTSVDATATGANVTVTWSAPVNNGGSAITSYIVTLSGPTATNPVTVNGSTFSAQFSNLGPGSYTASVVAVNATGTSGTESVNVSVGALTPSAPRNVQAISRGQEITVTWLAPSDGGNTPITGYQITIGLLVTTVNGASATSVVFADVPEGGPYVASVRAINGAGAGDAGVSNEFIATRPFAPFFSPDAFVAQQYRDFLGRSPDAPGLAFWKSLIDEDPANAPVVIESFMSSPEFAPRRQVARLYLAYFDRPPDRAGFDFWSELFISRQADLGVISAAFADSTEFQTKYGNLSDIEFVALVYNNVLLRAPDGPGITYWTGLLGQGMNRGEMMVFFSESPEFVIKSTPAVDVIVTYRGMLDRAPDVDGYRFWVRAVARSRDSLRDLIDGFLVSPEYSNRITP